MPGRSCCFLFVIWIAIVAAPRTGVGQQKKGDYPITPVPPTSVQVDHGLWKKRIETNRKVTIPYDFQKCEETGRIANFAIAAGQIDGKHQGFWFNDSDVFKVIEG
ncbi:MAG: glycoside hydrolase family 127 protein, partial [Pirellulales bacterium]|nr:glycoside hydrolase family 127 protein [Pirellulales bacterium]